MDFKLMQDSTASELVAPVHDGKDPNFFDQDYRASSIGIGFVWFWLSIWPAILFAAINPGKVCETYAGGKVCYTGAWSRGTKHFWNVMTISSGIFFGFTTLFWLLSYIHNRIMQKIYYRVIAWFIPASWIFGFWALLAAIIGGAQTNGKVGTNLGWWFLYIVGVAGCQALAWWQAPSMIKFYRWDSQEWWNYTKEDAPKNWPSQLGDFIDY